MYTVCTGTTTNCNWLHVIVLWLLLVFFNIRHADQMAYHFSHDVAQGVCNTMTLAAYESSWWCRRARHGGTDCNGVVYMQQSVELCGVWTVVRF